jgi:hypothetical protein
VDAASKKRFLESRKATLEGELRKQAPLAREIRRI